MNTNQEQSSNTPDFWADHICDVIDGITEWTLSPKQKEAIKANVRRWVLNIREDETEMIIREIERVAANPQSMTPASTQIIKLLRERLTKRP